MTEDFLQYIWQFKLFSPQARLVSGETFDVLSVGEKNTHAGPDFFNAKIRIGNTIWAGNVEVHINASDWKKHKHQDQKEYGNIILHVVFEKDSSIFDANGMEFPTLELKNQVYTDLWQRYQSFMQNNTWIACENLFSTVDEFTLNTFLYRLLVERFERKTAHIENLLKQTRDNWIETFYWELARNMGFRLNNQAFELLAKSLPFTQLLKHADHPMQVEAMIFGQAGMLNERFADAYPQHLQKEYQFLQQKFSLTPIEQHLWRFMRVHPNNFPTIRLAQFATMIRHSQTILSKITETTSIREISKLFKVEPSDYWLTHYQFDTASSMRKKAMGETGINLLIINFVVPFLYVYGKSKGNTDLMQRSIELLDELKPEQNAIIRRWGELGVNPCTAALSQGLLELKNMYCNHKKCLTCRIGATLIR